MTVRVLVAGGEGQLGREFPALAETNMQIVCLGRTELNICDVASIRRAVQQRAPTAIINAAAYTAVDRAESEGSKAFSINAQGVANLAQVAQETGIALLHVSSDYVFSGEKPIGEAYTETDICEPRTVYGRSKREGECLALALCDKTIVLRTSWVFGRYGANFPKTMLRLARERPEIQVVADQWGCPTYATDIAKTLLLAATALQKGALAAGIYHYAGAPACTWFDLASAILTQAAKHGHTLPTLTAINSKDYPTATPRPANSVLNCDKLNHALGLAPTNWQAGLAPVIQAVDGAVPSV
jgi:dTDP-4-dehydrorhamnose reductase